MTPRILIIDDLAGRRVKEDSNTERANLCGQYMLRDVTGDAESRDRAGSVNYPVADAVFCRGQRPVAAGRNDFVDNDLEGTLRIVREGWEISPPDEPRWAMVLLDLCFYTGYVTEVSESSRGKGMPEGQPGDDVLNGYFGLELLDAIHEEFPELPVAILSSRPREKVSRQFTERGAVGFLARRAEKGCEELEGLIQRHGLIPDPAGKIVGQSIPLLLTLKAARLLGASGRNVMIRGERGVGKELLAEFLHRNSERKDGPFVTVNSSHLTPELYGSTLFGILEGVATNVQSRQGMVVAAHQGDLFLDEIKDALPPVQSGLLRVLEEGEVTPIGGKIAQKVDVRFLAATNADLEALAEQGLFRDDLLDRLRSGGLLRIPPLHDRPEDLALLVEHFLRQAEESHPKALARSVEPEALDKLRSYSWPGNIRELQGCIYNAVYSNPDVEHLVSMHIKFSEPSSDRDSRIAAARTSIESAIEPSSPTCGEGSGWVQTDLRDSLPEIHARLADYLELALEETRDRVTGEIVPTRAFKMIAPESEWGKNPTTAAADLIKRLFGLRGTNTGAAPLAEGRPAIEQALRWARNQRKSSKG